MKPKPFDALSVSIKKKKSVKIVKLKSDLCEKIV